MMREISRNGRIAMSPEECIYCESPLCLIGGRRRCAWSKGEPPILPKSLCFRLQALAKEILDKDRLAETLDRYLREENPELTLHQRALLWPEKIA